jgi:hypothetical protein
MSDLTNKFRRKDKREAYERALTTISVYGLSKLNQPDTQSKLTNGIHRHFPTLDYAHARQVAAKAIRVMRGRRIRGEW